MKPVLVLKGVVNVVVVDVVVSVADVVDVVDVAVIVVAVFVVAGAADRATCAGGQRKGVGETSSTGEGEGRDGGKTGRVSKVRSKGANVSSRTTSEHTTAVLSDSRAVL